MFPQKKQLGYESIDGELWKHSLSTAIIAEHTRKTPGISKNDSIFISGFLHDVGKLVLSEFVEEELKKNTAFLKAAIPSKNTFQFSSIVLLY